MNKILYSASMMIIIASISFMGLVYYLLFFPLHSFKINDKNALSVLTKEVRPGEKFSYTINYCKYSEGEVKINRRVEDGIIYDLQTITRNLPVGCHQKEMSFLMPSQIATGEYHMHLNIQVPVNSIRRDSFDTVTETFKVLPSKEVSENERCVN